MDIGFVYGVLDTTTLMSFIGSNSGYITQWYDQSPNNNSLGVCSPTTPTCPVIINAGVLQLSYTYPAIYFSNANLFTPAQAQYEVGYVSTVVNRHSGNIGYILSDSGTSNYISAASELFGAGCAQDVCSTTSVGSCNNASSTPASGTPWPDQNSQNVILSVQTALVAPDTQWNNVGYNNGGGNTNYNGFYLELIVFNEYISAKDQLIIYNSQASFYGVTNSCS